MSSSVLPGADASRPRSGILTPTSDGTLNRSDGGSASSDRQKRKHADSVAMDHLLKPQIALKPHPPKLHVQPRVLQPLLLLPRKHLALSLLDLNAPQGDLPPSRLFEAHIKILDLESRMGSAPKVLIARNESKGTLYALERHDNGLYVACKLGSWTSLESLASYATALCQERIKPPAAKAAESDASSAIATPQTQKDQKTKRVAIEAIQSLVRKRTHSQSVSTFDDRTRPENSTNSHDDPAPLPSSDAKSGKPSDPIPNNTEEPKAPLANTEGDISQQQSAEGIFENIRTHYFEALYKSKGSLAYFAKGPLSRARSAFHLDLESDLDINDLIDFLKGLILTTVQVDKKYREMIPELVSKIKPIVDSSDEGRKKRRRPKKMKLGKDGLYPLEDEHIEKWWLANKPELDDDDEAGISMALIKAHASLLRTRETQLQMIVILEILALEPLKPQEQPADTLPALPGAAESQEQMAPPPPPKKRNKHNLPTLIDVHTDRLTIWQSMASHEQIMLQDSQVPSPSANGQVEQKPSSEPLKDFCIDVIVPFYSSRLPQLCDSLSRKLGGPVIVPPKPKSKSKSLERTSSKHDQKPGAAARRTALHKEPRTLERALSFEQQHRRSVSRGPSQIADLMRATSTSVPSIKREDSDSVNLKAVSKGELSSRQDGRSSLSRTSSMAGLEDTKANKKAKIEAELRDAISNLRKPNREVVGKAMAEAAERKASTATSAKKPRKVSKPAVSSGIQVKATPVNQRFRDVMAPKSEESADMPLPSTEDIIPPSSAGPLAPSTVLRSSHKNVWQNGASPALDVIGTTPLKQSTRQDFLRRSTFEEPAMPPSSPLVARKAAPLDSPIVPGSVVKLASKPDLSTARFADIPVTPIKKSAPRSVGKEPGAQEEKQTSIYQKLGWDDDELDDLL